MRFEKSLLKNINTRFNWRKALTLTIRVAETKQELLAAALNNPRWYQAALAGVRAQIHEAHGNEIAATITHDAWGDVETRARVKLKNIRGVDYAYVAHEGWIELPADLAQAERRRFVGLWINALSDFQLTEVAGAHQVVDWKGDGVIDLNYLPAHATTKGEVDINLDGVADEPGRRVSDWRKQA